MKTSPRRYLGKQIACITLWPVLMVAQSSDVAQNLSACKNGWVSCDHSKLTQTESDAVTVTDHQREVSNCRNHFSSCDHSKLTGETYRTGSCCLGRR